MGLEQIKKVAFEGGGGGRWKKTGEELKSFI